MTIDHDLQARFAQPFDNQLTTKRQPIDKPNDNQKITIGQPIANQLTTI